MQPSNDLEAWFHIKQGLLAREKNDMSRPEIVTTGGEWVNKKVISRTKSDKYLPASKLS